MNAFGDDYITSYGKIRIPSGNRKPEGIFCVQAEKCEVKFLKYNFKMK